MEFFDVFYKEIWSGNDLLWIVLNLMFYVFEECFCICVYFIIVVVVGCIVIYKYF